MTEEPEKVSVSKAPNLVKFLALSGVASRRHVCEFIKSGRVTLNGEVCLNPGYRVNEGDRIAFDGKEVHREEKLYYVMLNKPRGYVCTSEDVHAKKKAIDLIRIPGDPRLYSAGRLDKDSEGLIIFSNDGDFTAKLTHPGNGIVKIYAVTTDKAISPDGKAALLKGVKDAGDVLRALAIEEKSPCHYLLTLGEGKNREIRRMTSRIGIGVERLRRVAVGGLRLGGLPTGKWKFLTEKEIRLALAPGKRSSNAAIRTDKGGRSWHS